MHAWGLFARDAIPKEDFVIEYVGETIRSSLEDCKELEYQQSGLGSSYLFRVDKDTVVDATKKVLLTHLFSAGSGCVATVGWVWKQMQSCQTEVQRLMWLHQKIIHVLATCRMKGLSMRI